VAEAPPLLLTGARSPNPSLSAILCPVSAFAGKQSSTANDPLKVYCDAIKRRWSTLLLIAATLFLLIFVAGPPGPYEGSRAPRTTVNLEGFCAALE
jgi:hypothetical protein